MGELVGDGHIAGLGVRRRPGQVQPRSRTTTARPVLAVGDGLGQDAASFLSPTMRSLGHFRVGSIPWRRRKARSEAARAIDSVHSGALDGLGRPAGAPRREGWPPAEGFPAPPEPAPAGRLVVGHGHETFRGTGPGLVDEVAVGRVQLLEVPDLEPGPYMATTLRGVPVLETIVSPVTRAPKQPRRMRVSEGPDRQPW